MSDILKKLIDERDYQLNWAEWHSERRNTESAAIHRATAAGLKRAISIIATETPAKEGTP